jgi:hypothetical protein
MTARMSTASSELPRGIMLPKVATTCVRAPRETRALQRLVRPVLHPSSLVMLMQSSDS